MQITNLNSTIQTELMGFNECPSRETILRILNHIFSSVEPVQFVETDNPNWKNNTDTVVIAVKKVSILNPTALCRTLDAFIELYADEFHWEHVGDYLVIRLWWD